ncbi:MAG: Alpha-N-arabinofuranosidase [Acidobacteria bacterium]|nr:Alpha-N-arabinofuranosidase [Acidobacteriota bacterium]
MHFYSNGSDPATRFSPDAMNAQPSSFVRVEQAVLQQRVLLDSYDPARHVGLFPDEWGVGDRMDPQEEKANGRLWQQAALRPGHTDSCLAGLAALDPRAHEFQKCAEVTALVWKVGAAPGYVPPLLGMTVDIHGIPGKLPGNSFKRRDPPCDGSACRPVDARVAAVEDEIPHMEDIGLLENNHRITAGVGRPDRGSPS